ncbi:MAG: hypothetical protein AAF184_11850 [Pseudomonadota bacterium]
METSALTLVWVIGVGLAPSLGPVSYGSNFAERYWFEASCSDQIPEDEPTEQVRQYESPQGAWVAELTRTVGSIVPYERAQARLRVRAFDGRTVCLKTQDFRSLEVSWFGEDILLLNQNLGHVVGTEEIYDLQESSWLVQRTISYHKAWTRPNWQSGSN